MRRSLCAAVIAVLAGAGPASAGIDDGNSLYRYCSGTTGAVVMYCFGYVDSVVNDMQLYGSVAGYAACLPAVFEDNERRDVVIAFLDRHPRDRASGATELIAHAFADAYPCPENPAR
jgi:hypothetical protein